jgi:hypothetical protein
MGAARVFRAVLAGPADRHETAVTIFVNALAVYAVIGAVTALAFVTFGVTRVQPEPVSGGARILLFPGAVALWPCVLLRWRKSAR